MRGQGDKFDEADSQWEARVWRAANQIAISAECREASRSGGLRAGS